MSRAVPFVVAQLTDPHIGAAWSEDPAGALRAAIATAVRVLGRSPDAVVVSGDIANTPADSEYATARRLLDAGGAPVYVVPGNHDDREGLKRHFGLREIEGGHLAYAVGLGPLRLIALDTKRSDSDGGQLARAQLAWLDRVLAEDSVTPTLVVMHHPPIVTGILAMDAIGIPVAERAALAEIVARHPQIHVIAAGHVHRAIVGALGGVPVLAVPSTDAQLALDLEAEEMRFVSEPPCLALHVLADGRIVSHLQPIG